MDAATFTKLLESRICKIRDTLVTKAAEYATADRLYNFKAGAELSGKGPKEVCWDYMVKHLVSISDMARGVRPATPASIDEKIGDAINYLILLEALFHEP